jgi:hypothetical protein
MVHGGNPHHPSTADANEVTAAQIPTHNPSDKSKASISEVRLVSRCAANPAPPCGAKAPLRCSRLSVGWREFAAIWLFTCRPSVLVFQRDIGVMQFWSPCQKHRQAFVRNGVKAASFRFGRITGDSQIECLSSVSAYE